MNTKRKTGIGIALAVLMVAALAAPVSAEYVAEDTKMNIYKQGVGDLSYIYGDPFYQCIQGYNSSGSDAETATYNISLSSIPNLAKLIEDEDIEARLYVYWTWGAVDVCEKLKAGNVIVSWTKDYAVYPELEVEFNGETVLFDYANNTNWIDNYTDSKNIAVVGLKYGQTGYVSWNFPSGTNCSTIPIDKLSQVNNVVTVTNVHPYTTVDTSECTSPYLIGENSGRARVCIQGVGLLLIDTKVSHKEYWIAEGNDMTYVFWSTRSNKWTYGITPDMATTKVTFTGPVDEKMSKATLTSVIPAGNSPYNRLYFNSFYNYWNGLWNKGLPDPDGNLAVSETVVTANLCVGDYATNVNVAGFQNGLCLDPFAPKPVPQGDSQMNVAGAFLVVEK